MDVIRKACARFLGFELRAVCPKNGRAAGKTDAPRSQTDVPRGRPGALQEGPGGFLGGRLHVTHASIYSVGLLLINRPCGRYIIL